MDISTYPRFKLGTVTIKGWLPADLAGNKSRFTKTYRFTLTDQGYVGNGRKLYKTFDPSVLMQALGLVDPKIVSQSFCKTPVDFA